MEMKLGSASLFLMGCLLLGAGVVGGVMVERHLLIKCAVETREFSAKTVVCEDGMVYKLVVEETDRARWADFEKRLEEVEEVIRPAEPAEEPDAGEQLETHDRIDGGDEAR